MTAANSSKIPIAIVCNSVPPYRKHVHERIAREMPEARLWTLRTHLEDARWLTENEDEIGLVSLDNGVESPEQGFRKHMRREWQVGGRIIDFIRSHGIRAVVFVGYNDVGRVRALWWCKRHKISTLIWGDSNVRADDMLFKHRRFRAWIKRIIVTRILALSSGALSSGTAGRGFFKRYGVGDDRIFFFPLEPDYPAIRRLSPEAITRARQQYGFMEDRRRLLFCGRMIPIKRPDLLVDAFCAVADRKPAWDLIMLGDGPLRAEVEARTPASLRQRVIWLGHVADQDMVRAVQRCCDVLVLPSDHEPWALVINEALAAGMAIISTDVAGAAVDLVRDGVNGYTFPRGDQSALESRLLDASDEHQLKSLRSMASLVLADWIEKADPVRELRRALVTVGVPIPGAYNPRSK